MAQDTTRQDSVRRDSVRQDSIRRVHKRVRVTSPGEVDTAKIRAPSRRDSSLVRHEMHQDTASTPGDTLRPRKEPADTMPPKKPPR